MAPLGPGVNYLYFVSRDIISLSRDIISLSRNTISLSRNSISCLCTRCMLYDGQEVTYTPHTFKYNVVLEVHVLDVVLEV